MTNKNSQKEPSQAVVLSPPRSGRSIRTMLEVMEEIEIENALELRRRLLAPPLLVPEGVILDGPDKYFIAPGRFSVGGISGGPGGYVFHDLELPMGCWDKLTLVNPIEPDHCNSWAWGTRTRPASPAGVSPADVRYGLATVCFLNQDNKNLKDVVQEIRTTVLEPDSRVTHPFNSTVVMYRENDLAIVIPGYGWKDNHPFGVRYLASVACRKKSLITGPSAAKILESLLGENDPKRCESVMTWSNNVLPMETIEAMAHKPKARLYRLQKNQSGERGVGLYGVGRGSVVDATVYRETCRLARFIRADPKDYHRK